MALASQVFAFLEQHPTCAIERHEIYETTFGNLRRSLRFIALRLAENAETDALAIAERLRLLLSEWLTVPIPFDAGMLEGILLLGDPSTVEARWGRDIRLAYDAACSAARAIQNTENPIRTDLHATIQQLRTAGHTWRIYCHKKARAYFESIFDTQPLPDDCFLHTVKDYRDALPTDILIKVGPLRSRGWGSAPDAVLSAPRFATLIQIVWSGCADEEDFGYDPTAPPSLDHPGLPRATDATRQWTRRTVQIGHDDGDQTAALPDFDELKVFSTVARPRELRRATLVEIDEDHGILYPPQSPVLSFDPDSTTEPALALRVPGETLLETMFVVQPVLADPDLGGLQAADGYYGRIWKERLHAELVRNPADLVRRLRAAGLDLLHVLSRVRDWCRPPSTVIHAPQQRRHFEILIKELGIDHDTPPPAHSYRREWWQFAWNEIAHSRGEAIQNGLQEHEIISDELLLILEEQLGEIREAARAHASFQIALPTGKSLTGVVRFHYVRGIEEGFLVPENNLRSICDLDTIEQWRE